LAKGEIKSIVAKAVAATMDARELANKFEQPKDLEKPKSIFRPVNGETHACLTIYFHYYKQVL